MIQNLIKDAKLNEEQANAIIKDHLANMAAIDKATDEERARRVMALEMRLAERRVLSRQKVNCLKHFRYAGISLLLYRPA